MKVRDLMSKPVVRIHADEPVSVAARTLTHYNIGALPVCSTNGHLCGMVTDRDIVTRCLASGKSAMETSVKDVMSRNLTWATPEMDVDEAAKLMGTRQIRRLPVLEDGKLCGMVSLGDLAKAGETAGNAANALSRISNNVSSRK